MLSLMSLLRRKAPTFRHGVHPPEHKGWTDTLPVERMPFVDEYVLPLSQHIGAPAKAIVAAGDRVERGQRIADAGGFVSVPLHAPVTGKIAAVEPRLHPNGKMVESIVIETDPYASQHVATVEAVDVEALARDNPKEVIQRIQDAGLVGLGGAAFPSHVKLSVPEGKDIHTVVINGCECEPYLTCDHRVMAENPRDVLRGTQILMAMVGAKQGYVGVELNKPDAIEALKRHAPPDIEIIGLEVKYPQGAEKTLIDAIFDEEVPAGGLPLDLGILVNNVGTTAALAALFDRGVPLVERVITVTGPAIREPKNLIVPIGTPVRAIIEHCGGFTPDVKQVVMGGAMMGMAQKSLDVPILKGTSGLVALDTISVAGLEEMACIRCGRCVDACAMFLNPTRLMQLVRAERAEELEQYNINNCFECASCSYVCPSGIPLVQWMRVGKAMVRQQKKKGPAA
ncbi:MAG: electron transport complex subunit RsxC [Myxococcota bacterium]